MSAQKHRPGSFLGAILGTLSFSVIAGALVAVMITPAIAVTGATVNSTIGIFDSLPSFIEIDQQQEQNRIFATKDGKPYQIATIFNQNREEVEWDEVSDYAKDAAVSGEDNRFMEHGGVDVQGIIRAFVKNVAKGGVTEGASTITQQVVKNIFVQQSQEIEDPVASKAAYDAAIDPSFERKLKEMKLAIALEKKYSKQEILLAYLNIANFGGNTYGIQSAAERYFDTGAKDLTIAQAASLIAIVQYPNNLSLDDEAHYEANRIRRDYVINSMLTDGKITSAEATEAIATPVDKETVKLSDPRNGCIAANKYSKFFCDYIRNLVKDLPALGADPEERAANFKRGGYDIYTTLDLELQTAATKANRLWAPNAETALQLGSATVSVEVGTGRILIMTQNKEFDDSKDGGGGKKTAVNFSTDRDYGGSSGFQPGSTYKVFTLVNWLQNGHGLNEVVNGAGRSVPQSSFTDGCSGTWSGAPWQFKNDSGEKGSWTVAAATASSVNGAFVSMAQRLDLCGIRDTAQALGVHRADGGKLKHNPSSVLGINEIAPLTMAAAYAGIASGGKFCEPIAIDKIIGPNGKELPGQPKDCGKALEPEVADTAAYAMAGVMNGGTGSASNPNDGVEYIGKTGTTDSSNQTWIVGASRKVATAVWVGNIVGRYPMRSYATQGVGGGLLRHRIFNTVATAIDQQKEYRGGPFPGPAASLLTGSGVKVPDLRDKSLEYAKSVLGASGFTIKDGGPTNSVYEKGNVVRMEPKIGTLISRGSEITVFTSNGKLTEMPNVVGNGQQTWEQVAGQLNALGFTDVLLACKQVPGSYKDRVGFVIGSDPGPGKKMKYTDQVVVYVASLVCDDPIEEEDEEDGGNGGG